jgi:hypothetical protein
VKNVIATCVAWAETACATSCRLYEVKRRASRPQDTASQLMSLPASNTDQPTNGIA